MKFQEYAAKIEEKRNKKNDSNVVFEAKNLINTAKNNFQDRQ